MMVVNYLVQYQMEMTLRNFAHKPQFLNQTNCMMPNLLLHHLIKHH